ncbi:MAG: hypothetical protein AAF490_08430 [Chloroflexota bacterium]
MSFIEFESWEIKSGDEEAHHQMIRDWFNFVRDHHQALFAEWKSARYFRQLSKEGEPNGSYIMMFEFHTLDGFNAYKTRRDGFTGPYEAYKKVDPYQFFVDRSVKISYLEPQNEDLWFKFNNGGR